MAMEFNNGLATAYSVVMVVMSIIPICIFTFAATRF